MERNRIIKKYGEKNFSTLERSKDLDILLDRIGNSQFVLLGEASHGTSEFYRWRTEITKRLVKEKGFSFIAVEGDWPDCYKVNSYIKGFPNSGKNAYDVLHSFNRWPTWMWANKEIVELVEWLKLYNDKKQQQEQKQEQKKFHLFPILMEIENLLDFMVLISIAYGNLWKQLYNI